MGKRRPLNTPSACRSAYAAALSRPARATNAGSPALLPEHRTLETTPPVTYVTGVVQGSVMPVARLADRGVIRVAGEDARTFLDGLLTCDLDRVAPGRPRFGALLSPQGKILFDFIVF